MWHKFVNKAEMYSGFIGFRVVAGRVKIPKDATGEIKKFLYYFSLCFGALAAMKKNGCKMHKFYNLTPFSQVAVAMVIVTDALLLIVLNKFKSAVHHYRCP